MNELKFASKTYIHKQSHEIGNETCEYFCSFVQKNISGIFETKEIVELQQALIKFWSLSIINTRSII